jgi:toxin ParE1/3/4
MFWENSTLKIEWSDRSVYDLEDIHSYIAKDSKNNAGKFIDTLVGATRILESSPHIGRKVPELDDDTIRELIHQNYRIVYKCAPSTITILTVFEGHRRLKDV